MHTVLRLHRPDLSLQRLTPDNCRKYLFDDVLWVKRARQEHDGFTDALRETGVEVLDLGELLGETIADKAARKWLLDLRISADQVGRLKTPPPIIEPITNAVSDRRPSLPVFDVWPSMVVAVIA